MYYIRSLSPAELKPGLSPMMKEKTKAKAKLDDERGG
jgi:hypothetical protein